jgi:type II secretory pathway pseudopilin PulG
MAALLVTLAVMMVLMTVALPVLTTMAQRERETELVFRGQQYARAIALFQRKYGNAYPPNLDVLLNEKFLRKKYKDPITGDDFNLLGPGSPELAAALNAAPVAGQAGQQQGQQQSQQQGTRQTPQATSARTQQPSSGFGSQMTSGSQAPGGLMAVASKSTKTSLRIYNGHDKYNEWVFMPTQASLAAGGGARGGAAGGAGGAAGRGGRGGRESAPPNGRVGSPRGNPQSPFGTPPSPFGQRGPSPAPQGPRP